MVEEAMHPLLAIQVTVFKCGRLAIGVCTTHSVADSGTLSMFLEAWGVGINKMLLRKFFHVLTWLFTFQNDVFPISILKHSQVLAAIVLGGSRSTTWVTDIVQPVNIKVRTT